MTDINWDSTPTNGDCFNATAWADMVTYIKHSAACDFTIYDDDLSTSQKFKFSYAGNDNTLEGDDTTAKNLILKATGADAYPKILLEGDTNIKQHFKSGSSLYIYDSATQAFKMRYSASPNRSIIEGGHTTGDTLKLKANDIDSYPYIDLHGNTDIKQYFTSGGACYLYDATTQVFKQSYAANVSTIEGGHVTADSLTLKANDVDAYPHIDLIGGAEIDYQAADYHYFYGSATKILGVWLDGDDSMVCGQNDTTKHLMLKANETDNYPYVDLIGDSNIEYYSGSEHHFYSGPTISFALKHSANVSTIRGGDVTGDILVLKANETNTYPNIVLFGNDYTLIDSKNGIYFNEQGTRSLSVTKGGVRTIIIGGSLTGDELRVQANITDTYPYIDLIGNTDIKQYFKAGSAFYLYDSAVQAFKMKYAANVSTIEGGATTGNYLVLKANTTDATPRIELLGNSYASIHYKTGETFRIYEDATPAFFFGYAANLSTMYGGFITGDDLKLKANVPDAYPYISLLGDAGINTSVKYGSGFQLMSGPTNMFRVDYNVASGGFTNISGPNISAGDLKIHGNQWDTYPYITMNGDSYMEYYSKNNHYFYSSANQIMQLSFSGNTSSLKGNNATGKNLELYANGTDSYPYVSLIGNSAIHYYSHNDHYFYADAANYIKFTGNAGAGVIKGPTATATDLILDANQTDAYPRIRLYGNAGINMSVAATNNFDLYSGPTNMLRVSYAIGDNATWLKGSNITSKSLGFSANSADTYPYITLNGGGGISAFYTSGNAFSMRDGSTRSHKFSYAANVSTIAGGSTTGDSMVLSANATDTYPYLKLVGNSYAFLSFKSGGTFRLYDESTMAYYFAHSANNSKLYGGGVTGDDIEIHANTIDSYPYVKLNGDAGISEYVKSTGYWNYYNEGNRVLSFGGSASALYMYGGGTTGFITYLYGCAADAYPYIELDGNAEIKLKAAAGDEVRIYSGPTNTFSFDIGGDNSVMNTNGRTMLTQVDANVYQYLYVGGGILESVTAGNSFTIAENGSGIIRFNHSGTDVVIEGLPADHDLDLLPNGTGVVKFGTYSAKGAEAFDGFITIKDAAGNTRKLMTCA